TRGPPPRSREDRARRRDPEKAGTADAAGTEGGPQAPGAGVCAPRRSRPRPDRQLDPASPRALERLRLPARALRRRDPACVQDHPRSRRLRRHVLGSKLPPRCGRRRRARGAPQTGQPPVRPEGRRCPGGTPRRAFRNGARSSFGSGSQVDPTGRVALLVLAFPVALGVLLGVVVGGDPRKLAAIRLRRIELFYLAFVLQLVAFPLAFLPWRTDDRMATALWLVSYALLVVGAIANRRIIGVPVVAAGMASNVIAVVANSGHMPALPQALRAANKHY